MNAKLKLSSLFVIQNRNSRINRATRLLLSSLRVASGMSGKGWPTVSPRLSPRRFCAREADSVPYFEVADSRSDRHRLLRRLLCI
jgi:hypothetical protein